MALNTNIQAGATTHISDHDAIAAVINALDVTGTTTVLNGTTAGSVTWLMPFQGEYKRFVAVLNGYENTTATAQTITFPTAFVTAAEISGGADTGSTASLTTLTLPASMASAVSGLLIVEGF